MEIVTFRAARMLLGVPMEEVQEIVDSWSLTPLPLLPDVFRGVTSLRGTPLPVADMTRLVGGGLSEAPRRTIVVLRSSIALLVDTIETLVEVEGLEEEKDAPPWVGGRAGDIRIVDRRGLYPG